MGLLDFFKKAPEPSAKRVDRELGRLERLVSNKLSQNPDRQDAIEQLGRIATAQSSAILLKRFNWYLDPSITDQEEKEAVVRGLVEAGEAALVPIREYCRRAESLTWPLKALEQIVPGERFAEELLGLLDQFDTEYVRNHDPKVQLLTALEAHPGDEARQAIEPFLEDATEAVRFAAVGAVFAMGQAEAVASLLAALEGEESLRIKNRVAQGILERGWTVPDDLAELCRRCLPSGYRLQQGRVVR